MKKILFFTSANLVGNTGDVVLLKRRAEGFFQSYGIKTICYTLKSCDSICNEFIEFKNIQNLKEFELEVKEFNIAFIIIYGTRAYKYLNLLLKFKKVYFNNAKIFCDVQGVPEEIIDFKFGIKKILKYPNFLAHKWILKYALNKTDGAFVVTSKLESYCKKLTKKNKIYIKIRCGIDNKLSLEEIKENRFEVRKKWGISDDVKVFVFSGHLFAWQNFNEILNLFSKIDANNENCFFAFFCNADEKTKEKINLKLTNGNFVIDFLSPDVYYKYLSACDVGFLSRKNKTTNNVAFPNKFSDYINANLMVALNSYLYEPVSLLEKYNVRYINLDNFNECNLTISSCEDRFEKYNSLINNELTYISQINVFGDETKRMLEIK